MGLDMYINGEAVEKRQGVGARRLNTNVRWRVQNPRQRKKHIANVKADKGCFHLAYSEAPEIYYWRKFNPLHGWFESNYSIDNCEQVELDADMLDRIEADAQEGKLVTTGGFFYGGEWSQDEIIEALTPGLEAARAALARGERIFYHGWW